MVSIWREKDHAMNPMHGNMVQCNDVGFNCDVVPRNLVNAGSCERPPVLAARSFGCRSCSLAVQSATWHHVVQGTVMARHWQDRLAHRVHAAG